MSELTLYHGSPEDTSEIIVKDDEGLFDGVFCHHNIDAAASHGNIYSIDLDESEIMDEISLLDMSYEKMCDIIRKIMHNNLSEEELDILSDAICYEEADQYDERWQEIIGKDDPAEIGWEIQRLRGRFAKELGFKAVTIHDECGMSYLVLPGNTLKRI